MPRRLSMFLSSFVIFWMIQLGCRVLAQSPKEITNSIGMKLVLIRAGKFTMGSRPDDIVYSERTDSNGNSAQHAVSIRNSFYLGAYEVTQGQYEKVMGVNPSKFQADAIGNRDSSSNPVEQISWEDAVQFCLNLSASREEKKAGRVYRLPTESEWEYACRAGSTTAFSYGERVSQLKNYGWYNQNAEGLTHPIGEKKPNDWGLYDMHGNVQEWCWDWYGDYQRDVATDPSGPFDGTYRMVRGGAWDMSHPHCRSFKRFLNLPTTRLHSVGFRIVMNRTRN